MKSLLVAFVIGLSTTLSFAQLSYNLELGLNASVVERYRGSSQVMIITGPAKRALNFKLGILADYKFKNENSFTFGLQLRRYGSNSYNYIINPVDLVTNVRAYYGVLPIYYNQKVISDKIFLSFGLSIDYLIYVYENSETNLIGGLIQGSDKINFTGFIGFLFNINEDENITLGFSSQLKSFIPKSGPFNQFGKPLYHRQYFNSFDFSYRVSFTRLKKFLKNEQ